MENQPIDNLSEVQISSPQGGDPIVKVVAGALFLIVLVFSFLCFNDIVRLLDNYFMFRKKWVSIIELHSIIAAISLSTIPLITYYHWFRRFKKQGFVPYMLLLFALVGLFVIVYLLGIELIFVLPKKSDINPLLPSYIIFPPFRFYFDLLFIVAVLFGFALLQLVVRNRK